MPTSTKSAFAETHKQLRKILHKHAKGSLKVKRDASGNEVVMGPPTEQSRGRDLWFGSVRTAKAPGFARRRIAGAEEADAGKILLQFSPAGHQALQ